VTADGAAIQGSAESPPLPAGLDPSAAGETPPDSFGTVTTTGPEESRRHQTRRRVVRVQIGRLVRAIRDGDEFWFSVTLSAVVAVMMVTYVAVPGRLIGVKSERSRKDKLTAAAVGGAIGAVVCSPPFALGRVAILMLGSHTLRYLAVVMLAVAVVLQTGATSSVKAIKMSAKLTVHAAAATAVSGPAHSTE
jgi:hypothetical protein